MHRLLMTIHFAALVTLSLVLASHNALEGTLLLIVGLTGWIAAIHKYNCEHPGFDARQLARYREEA